mgnify:CR=1 FL=1
MNPEQTCKHGGAYKEDKQADTLTDTEQTDIYEAYNPKRHEANWAHAVEKRQHTESQKKTQPKTRLEYCSTDRHTPSIETQEQRWRGGSRQVARPGRCQLWKNQLCLFYLKKHAIVASCAYRCPDVPILDSHRYSRDHSLWETVVSLSMTFIASTLRESDDRCNARWETDRGYHTERLQEQ